MRDPQLSRGEIPMEPAAEAKLTTCSRMRFHIGGFFCTMSGICPLAPFDFRVEFGFVGLVIFNTLLAFIIAIPYTVIAFGIAYAAKGRKKVRNWNAVSQWFCGVAVIASFLTESALTVRSC